MPDLALYTYFRSSASYRVRIALNLKNITAQMLPVNLLKGEQHQEEYKTLNPQGLVPALVVEDGKHVLTQSLAIIEYLEETHPQPALLPNEPVARAQARALSLAIACEIAPLNNLRTLKFLENDWQLDQEKRNEWYRHWIAIGFEAVEKMLAESPCTGDYCHGNTPGMADCVLVPQLFNAQRFQCDMTAFPTAMRIFEACEKHPAFIAAHPKNQKDAV